MTIGAFFEPKLKERFGVVEDRHVLLDSLRAGNVPPPGSAIGRHGSEPIGGRRTLTE